MPARHIPETLPASFMKPGKARLIKEPRATPLKWFMVCLGGSVGGVLGYIVLRELGLYYRIPGKEKEIPAMNSTMDPVSQTVNDFEDVQQQVGGYGYWSLLETILSELC